MENAAHKGRRASLQLEAAMPSPPDRTLRPEESRRKAPAVEGPRTLPARAVATIKTGDKGQVRILVSADLDTVDIRLFGIHRGTWQSLPTGLRIRPPPRPTPHSWAPRGAPRDRGGARAGTMRTPIDEQSRRAPLRLEPSGRPSRPERDALQLARAFAAARHRLAVERLADRLKLLVCPRCGRALP